MNLPGGELRRRGAEDELSMRKYLQVSLPFDILLGTIIFCTGVNFHIFYRRET